MDWRPGLLEEDWDLAAGSSWCLSSWLGFDQHRSHATSLAAIVLIAAAGAVSFGMSDELALGIGVVIGMGGIVGSVIGASVMHRTSPRTLTIIFGIVLLVAGLRMIGGANPLPDA
ncbi:MAG: TSUP family transporter, partial [Actinobacteria bacterium]|nr:TSUP family transporter [Actinomycetota bacterium]